MNHVRIFILLALFGSIISTMCMDLERQGAVPNNPLISETSRSAMLSLSGNTLTAPLRARPKDHRATQILMAICLANIMAHSIAPKTSLREISPILAAFGPLPMASLSAGIFAKGLYANMQEFFIQERKLSLAALERAHKLQMRQHGVQNPITPLFNSTEKKNLINTGSTQRQTCCGFINECLRAKTPRVTIACALAGIALRYVHTLKNASDLNHVLTGSLMLILAGTPYICGFQEAMQTRKRVIQNMIELAQERHNTQMQAIQSSEAIDPTESSSWFSDTENEEQEENSPRRCRWLCW